MFVATAPLIPVGDQLIVELRLPGGDRSISLDSRVQWLRRQRAPGRRARPAGMGLQFVNLTTETSAVIGSFLQAQLLPFAGTPRGRSGH
jgi:Tfp pilus assembly protein PilZ